jgi:hypothetical protein
MEKIDIIYERKLSGSYMKIISDSEGGFDERMLQKQQIPGLLPMEICYLDGSRQYWYNISGKQSLDTFCHVKQVGQAFLEQLVHSVCDELQVLEQHLVDGNCLCLIPELVYVSIQTGEISFTAIPGRADDMVDGFRELLEYLLTKVDHKDTKAVQLAYDIYEKTLDEGYSINEIQDSILQAHILEEGKDGVSTGKQRLEYQERSETMQPAAKTDSEDLEGQGVGKETDKIGLFLRFWKETICVKLRKPQKWKKEKPIWKQEVKEEPEEWKIIYPDDELQEEIHNRIHPTICLSDFREHPEGLLLYEGYENFPNIRLEKNSLQIGHSEDSDIIIEKDTISRYHARIECEAQEYFLEDLNSTNGTFVNEKQLTYKEKRKLQSNDIIRFADVKYRFV